MCGRVCVQLTYKCDITSLLTSCRYKFKATPVNAAVFELEGMLGVPHKIPQRPLAPPATPELATKQRFLERKDKEEEEEESQNSSTSGGGFIAKPMPDFSKVTVRGRYLYTVNLCEG